jgi:deazaflavin-dependent oxidoreductase (nitroreductase family)
MAGAVWAWWSIDPSAPQGPALPAAVSTALAANVALSLTSVRLKRAAVAPVQRYLINPPVRVLLGLGLMPLGYALLETRGRVTGLPRTTPVGNGLHGGTFWVIAEHGLQAGYVRNIQRCPDVRLKLRQGWRFVWLNGTAHILPDDNPYARQRRLSCRHPLRALNLAIVRIMGTNLLTIRIDLHTSHRPDTLRETGERRTDQPASSPQGEPRHPPLLTGIPPSSKPGAKHRGTTDAYPVDPLTSPTTKFGRSLDRRPLRLPLPLRVEEPSGREWNQRSYLGDEGAGSADGLRAHFSPRRRALPDMSKMRVLAVEQDVARGRA